jgi:hypothetical protein
MSLRKKKKARNLPSRPLGAPASLMMRQTLLGKYIMTPLVGSGFLERGEYVLEYLG